MPTCSTVNEVNQFFRNTLKRNHTGLRPDVLVSSSDDGLLSDFATTDSLSLDLNVEIVKGSSPLYCNSCGDPSSQFSHIDISDCNNHGSIKQKQCNSVVGHKEIVSVSGGLIGTNATDHAITDSGTVRNDGDFYEAPHQFYQSENGKNVDVRDDIDLLHHGMSANQFTDRSFHSFEDAKHHNEFSRSFPAPFEHNAYSPAVLADGMATSNSMFTLENSQPGGTINDIVPDLTGDFFTNFNNLLFAQGCQQGNLIHHYYYPMPPPPLQYQNMRPSNGHVRKNPYGYAGMNGESPSPLYPPGYVVWRPVCQTDDRIPMRGHGTGTYFPDPNLRNDTPPSGRGERGRNRFSSNNYQKFHHHVRTDMPVDMVPLQESWHDVPLQTYVPGSNDHGIPSPMNMTMPSPSSQSRKDPLKVPAHSPSSQVRTDNFHGNGFMLPQDSKLEFRTLGTLPLEVTSKDHAKRSDSASSNQVSETVSPMRATKRPLAGLKGMRNAQPYRLKDSGDFPPLPS